MSDMQLPSWSRGGRTIDQIVIHESVTSSREATLAVLKRRNLSVHFIVGRDGSVTQHAPVANQCAHAGSKHNRRSVAIEVVNRYYGQHASRTEQTISARWAHRGLYILPTLAQAEAVHALVERLCREIPTIPLVFPGAVRGFVWGRLPLLQRVRPPAGIMAHHRTDHADGLFVEHYVWRRVLGEDSSRAFASTVAAAQGVVA